MYTMEYLHGTEGDGRGIECEVSGVSPLSRDTVWEHWKCLYLGWARGQ